MLQTNKEARESYVDGLRQGRIDYNDKRLKSNKTLSSYPAKWQEGYFIGWQAEFDKDPSFCGCQCNVCKKS